MGKPNQAARDKRSRELSKREHKQEKLEKRAQRNEQRKDREQLIANGIDPDLAGIVPGPQPINEDY